MMRANAEDRHDRVFRDAGMILNLQNQEDLERVHDSSFQRQKRLQRLLIVGTIGFLAIVLVALNSGRNIEQKDVTQIKDPYFYEPETQINNPRKQPHPEYVSHTSECPKYEQDAPLAWDQGVDWVQLGDEVTKFIKDRFKANSDYSNKYTNHFGYGNNVAISADGKRMAASFEGGTGFDAAFGSHVEVYSFNGTKWGLEQVISDVRRGHGHSHLVHFQSLAMSSNGQRIAFSDGHGVAVFEFNPDTTETPWVNITAIEDPYQDQHANISNPDDHHHQFGKKLAMNCDGSIVAVAGSAEKYSYVKVYELEFHELSKWVEIGEVQNIQFGGSIALSSTGTRLAVGSVAAESWRGMVQVFENKAGVWWRIGQPIVGEKPLENWGGSVSLSDDGNIVAVSSKNGVANRVAVYKLLPNPDNEQLRSWQQRGPYLQGKGNRHEHFGYDIDLNHDGSILAVSAPGDYELAEEERSGTTIAIKDIPFVRGKIHIYRFENNDWIKLDHNNIGGTTDGDMFGSSIALSGDGLTVIGGAPRREGKAYQHMLGGVQVYKAVLGEQQTSP